MKVHDMEYVTVGLISAWVAVISETNSDKGRDANDNIDKAFTQDMERTEELQLIKWDIP